MALFLLPTCRVSRDLLSSERIELELANLMNWQKQMPGIVVQRAKSEMKVELTSVFVDGVHLNGSNTDQLLSIV